jgi:hypothetical protein
MPSAPPGGTELLAGANCGDTGPPPRGCCGIPPVGGIAPPPPGTGMGGAGAVCGRFCAVCPADCGVWLAVPVCGDGPEGSPGFGPPGGGPCWGPALSGGGGGICGLPIRPRGICIERGPIWLVGVIGCLSLREHELQNVHLGLIECCDLSVYPGEKRLDIAQF